MLQHRTFVRPILEFAVPVLNLGLTGHQINCLEGIQRQTHHMILPDPNCKEVLETTGLPTLQQRRQQICLNFALGLLNSDEFSSWLPPKRGACHQPSLRSSDKLNTDRKDETV